MLTAEVVHHYFPKLVELHNYRCAAKVRVLSVCSILLYTPRKALQAPRLRLAAACSSLCSHHRRRPSSAAVLTQPQCNFSTRRPCASLDLQEDLDKHPKTNEVALGGSGAHGLAQKLYNWSTLNTRVFRRLGFVVARAECEAVALCEPGALERVLKLVRARIADHAERQRQLTEPVVAAGDEPAAQVCSLLATRLLPAGRQPGELAGLRGARRTPA